MNPACKKCGGETERYQPMFGPLEYVCANESACGVLTVTSASEGSWGGLYDGVINGRRGGKTLAMADKIEQLSKDLAKSRIFVPQTPTSPKSAQPGEIRACPDGLDRPVVRRNNPHPMVGESDSVYALPGGSCYYWRGGTQLWRLIDHASLSTPWEVLPGR